ncbi:MAG: LCP family protein [Patescibacteria group bacterium]
MKRIILPIGEKDNPVKVKRVKKILKKLIPFALLIGILTALAVFLATLSGSSTTVNIPFLGIVSPLKNTDGNVNVLFLGIAGGIHQGASLTDTIVVASYNLKTKQLYFFSIPRDLWLPALQSKANAAYQMGLSTGDGLDLAKTVMGNVLGIPIHYGLRIDFRGFVQGIDALGGVEVEVARSFEDPLYPIEGRENDLCGFEEKEIDFLEDQAKELNIEPGKRKVFVAPDGKIATNSAEEDKGIKYFSCRYELIRFEKGKTYMDGTAALKYVRSRHGSNGEGSDFARSKRQEKILNAVRNKMLSTDTLLNPSRISELFKTIGKSIDTDVSLKDALEFYKLSKKIEGTNTFTLDDSLKTGILPEGRDRLLIHPDSNDYGGAYVLISQDDDFSIVHEYVRKILNGEITAHEATTSARSGDH